MKDRSIQNVCAIRKQDSVGSGMELDHEYLKADLNQSSEYLQGPILLNFFAMTNGTLTNSVPLTHLTNLQCDQMIF